MLSHFDIFQQVLAFYLLVTIYVFQIAAVGHFVAGMFQSVIVETKLK
jgi:hypothetical protein